jgi:hypothetical protein
MNETNIQNNTPSQNEPELHPWLEAESHGDQQLRALLGNKEQVIEAIVSREVDPDIGKYNPQTNEEIEPSLREQLSITIDAINNRKSELGIEVLKPLPAKDKKPDLE